MWLFPFLLASAAAYSDGILSRRHRDATPFIEDINHSLWSDDPTSDVINGVLSSKTEIHTKIEDSCDSHYCEKGKSCRIGWNGEPLCECRPFCPRHRKLVCATDGRLFLNHCELHRTACLEKSRLHIDKAKRCFHQGTKVTWGLEPESTTIIPRLKQTYQTRNSREMERYFMKNRKQEIEILTTSAHFPIVKDEYSTGESIVRHECELQQYEILKDNVLLYQRSRLLSDNGSGSEREYLVGLMFSHFDSNNNGNLDEAELNKVSEQEGVRRLSDDCTLSDLIHFDDTNKDGRLSLNEFYNAFSVSVVSLEKSLAINQISARVGDNLEINCDITGTPTPPIVWRRHGLDLAALNSEDIRVFVDGSLYLTKLQLVHAGNYTCHADRNKEIVQTHTLKIYTVPIVRVTPHIQSLMPGDNAVMRCRASGEPFPKVEWLKNDEPLRVDIPNKYSIIGNGSELEVRSIGYADTGAYMCQATSIGGMSRDISSLVVQEHPTPSTSQESWFFVFHESGAAVYAPDDCRLHHVIQGTDVIPGTQEYVCGDKGTNCSWGRVISVGPRYIYASQPTRDRVLVISILQMVVVDVIVTDQYPVELSYVENLDQVWVLNWRSVKDEGIKTIQVIRDASKKKKHHTVHPEPIDGHFDLVKDLFVPKTQDLGHEFRYAYVTHTNQRGLYKLDLANMKYVKTVDLTPYNCVPQHLVFSSLYGLVVMECEEPVTRRRTGQLVIDYLTDAVLSHKSQLSGNPHILPDSSLVVTIDTRDRVEIFVQKVTEHGLAYLYDVSTTLNISDATSFPSRQSHSYDLFAASTDKDDILVLDLKTGKVEVMTGVGKAMSPSLTEWHNTNRAIISSGIFGHYLVSPSSSAIYVINGETQTVNCEIGSLSHPRLVVWVKPKYMLPVE